jgi:tRNA threonylcarbamoyladenosine biosynthesis protein TsaE
VNGRTAAEYETVRVSADAAETVALGRCLARFLEPEDTVLLQGPLGSGKTTLAQGIAEGLGASAATSPTFVLIQEYRGGRLPVYHIDLYRIESEVEAWALGLTDYFYGDGVCLVEWPERAPALMPDDAVVIQIEFLDGEGRRLTFRATGPRSAEVLRRFDERC